MALDAKGLCGESTGDYIEREGEFIFAEDITDFD